MKMRIYIWIIALLISWGFCLKWYFSLPPILKFEPHKQQEAVINKIDDTYMSYKGQKFLLYWSGGNPSIDDDMSTIRFTEGVWLLRSIDPTGSISVYWQNKLVGLIRGKGTVFLDFRNNILLSVDALISIENTKILPSFYIQNDKKMFYDIGDIEEIIDKDIWNIYKNNVIKDEREIYSGFSEKEIIDNINTLLSREPKKENWWNTFFKKDIRIRIILEDILQYMENVKKQNKCWDIAGSCVRFMMSKIEEGERIDQSIFMWIKEPLLMWARKNSSIEVNYSWESIFQKYHLDILSDSSASSMVSAINVRDNAIINMIRTTQNPTYEMWLYLTHILSRENKGSSYSIKIMTEMIRLGEILKNTPWNKEIILEESNRALANLRSILETTYFDKKDDYLFVLKENLRDDKSQKIDTMTFVTDLNQLISEVDKSTLFLEYPDFRVLRRHLSWFTCIFAKNKEYLEDIRVCRWEL